MRSKFCHLAVISGLLAIGLYVLDGSPARRGALVPGRTRRSWPRFWCGWRCRAIRAEHRRELRSRVNNFIKTAIMSFVIAGSVRRRATWSASRSCTSPAP